MKNETENIIVKKTFVLASTRALLEFLIRRRIEKDKSPFTLLELLGIRWQPEFEPFYDLYDHLKDIPKQQDRTAVQQMGKLFKEICDKLGLKSHKINGGRRTEYFLN